MITDVRSRNGAPVLADFTKSDGTPLVIDRDSGRSYALVNGEAIVSITSGLTSNGVDDTAAVNRAITYLPGGANLDYDGPLILSSTLSISKPLILRGMGPSGTRELVSTRPKSYFLKKSTATGPAISFATDGVSMEGGGVVAEAGGAGDNIWVLGNSPSLRHVTSIGAAGVGIRVGYDTGTNTNAWRLDDCRAYGNGGHGFYISDSASTVGSNANAGVANGCISMFNTGDGYRINNANFCTFNGCLGELNTGYGCHVENGNNHVFEGGDYEANTAGQFIIDAAAQYTTLIGLYPNVVAIDNGTLTIRLDLVREAGRVSYPITWKALTADPAIGNGTLVAFYERETATRVRVNFFLTLGGTTATGTGVWYLTLPSGMTQAATYTAVGPLYFFDSAAGKVKAGSCSIGPGDTRIFMTKDDAFTAAIPHAWAATDYIRGELMVNA